MRSLVVFCVMVGLALFLVSGASAADLKTAPAQQGQVSNEMLAAMGMGGMQRLSDAQGEQIRGKCWVIAVNAVWLSRTLNTNITQTINVNAATTAANAVWASRAINTTITQTININSISTVH